MYQIKLNDHHEEESYNYRHGIKGDYVHLDIKTLNRLLADKSNPEWLAMHNMICALVHNDLFEEVAGK